MNSVVLPNHSDAEASQPTDNRLLGDAPFSAFSSSLLAEYAGMLLSVQAVFCAAIRLLTVGNNVSVVAGVVASLWVGVRAIQLVRWQWFVPIVTMLNMATLIWVEFGSEATGLLAAAAGPFSALAVLIMLAVVLIFDLTESVHVARRTLQVPESRDRLTAIVFQHGLRTLLWGTVGFIMGYSIVVPLVQEVLYQQTAAETDPKLAMDRLTLAQNMLFKFTESMSGMWFFVVGACVGSFLNVVIYRVPLRISVLAKPSHCPSCSEKIKGRDNLPLVGWLKLAGRCRNCGIAISSRYPTVELTIGLVFLALYFVELISGGTNLPGRAPNGYAGVLWILFYTKWDLVGLYFFHCLLMCTVFSWAMIRRDGNRVPMLSVLSMMAIFAVAIGVFPDLQPLYGLDTGNFNDARAHDIGMFATTSGLGIGAALVVAGLARWFDVRDKNFLPADLASWLLIGLALGWQAVVGVMLLCFVWDILRSVHQAVFVDHVRVFGGTNIHLLLPWILFIHHCVWRDLFSIFTDS